jgi:hypothetical protein
MHVPYVTVLDLSFVQTSSVQMMAARKVRRLSYAYLMRPYVSYPIHILSQYGSYTS